MRLVVVAGLFAVFGCTTVNTAALPQGGGGGDVFVTTADVKEPYRSLGLVQATRKGAVLFGWIDPAGTDLDEGVKDLVDEARRMGGDGVINVRFEQTQYTPAARVVAMLLFLVPLPAQVTVRGEVIRLGQPASGAGAAR